ncbi:MAG: single-stranded DNA-binding protein [Candidatus Obscuribacterales bacterium]
MNNTITIVGYVGQNPHVISFGDTGNKVVKFSVAVKEFSANTDENKTLWLDVDAWNGLGERILKTVTKGREVVVHGRLALSTFNKEVNGTKVEMTKPVVKLTSFHLCGKRPTSNAESSSDESTRAESPKKTKLASVKG